MPKIRAVVNPVRTRRAMPGAHTGALVAAFTKKLAIAVLGHPAGAGEMRVVNAARTLRLGVGINLENHVDGLAPIGAISRRVEDAHIFLHMRAIVVGQLRAVRWRIKEVRLCHCAQFAPETCIISTAKSIVNLDR